MSPVDIHYQGDYVGAVSFDRDRGYGAFEYDSGFIKRGIELSPLRMAVDRQIYTFPTLQYETFKGLPGLLADSLPDDFGHAILNSWAASINRDVKSITPLERLSYTGKRGMGALEYSPATKIRGLNASTSIEIDSLVKVAQEILDLQDQFSISLNGTGEEDHEAMLALLSVGTSAGGARPKAVLAISENLKQVRSGQTDAPDGFTHYLMKFDGVSEHNKNRETFGDPLGYGAMEYVYYLMATECGIDMKPCSLLQEGSRRHFITERFDRIGNKKVHIQTLNGLAHIDYRQPGLFSYAELFGVARDLNLPKEDAIQLYRRMVFNIIARNHDDHSKNFSFLLNEENSNQWELSPAYDLAYSYKPGSRWVDQHWMSLNGKRDHFTREDFYSLENVSPIFTRAFTDEIIDQTIESLSKWSELAKSKDVPDALIDEIESNLRLKI